MDFDYSNNEAKYEALITGLKILKKLNAEGISAYGDLELVIKQVKGEYQAKHPQMRAYRNAVLDILIMFPEYTLTAVPRTQNIIVDSLATAASNLKILMNSSNKFEIHVKHRPAIPIIKGIGKCFGMIMKSIPFCRMKKNSRILPLMMIVIPIKKRLR